MGAWLEIALDDRCNLRCIGCHACRDEGGSLTGAQALALLREHRARGATSLWIGGGEPTLRDELFSLVVAARKLGYARVLLQTNGMRLAYPAYTAALVRAGVTDVSLNLKSHDAARHDALSGGASHALLLRALEELAGKGVAIGGDVLLARSTLGDLGETVDFFAARGVGRFALWLLSAADVPTDDVRAEVPRLSDLVGPLRTARDAARRHGVALVSYHTLPCTLPADLRELFVPAASLGITVVGPDLRPFPLASSPFEGGAYVPGCDGCAARSSCGGPRADYLALHGANEFAALPATLDGAP